MKFSEEILNKYQRKLSNMFKRGRSSEEAAYNRGVIDGIKLINSHNREQAEYKALSKLNGNDFLKYVSDNLKR